MTFPALRLELLIPCFRAEPFARSQLTYGQRCGAFNMGKKRWSPDSGENIRRKMGRQIDSSSSDIRPNRDDPVQEVDRTQTIWPLLLEEYAPVLNLTPAVAPTSLKSAPSTGRDGDQPQEQTNDGTPARAPSRLPQRRHAATSERLGSPPACASAAPPRRAAADNSSADAQASLSLIIY
ncbi:uncharacterized protein LOC121727677 [Aricia agestis]|uniref:uncharacterized protein LOC121727677 n=1 Tax=Aricia agestis TaxID=91739 RepID=UPI001C209EB0|nr:uncharacterized protein LOC121727677 [Aricia agestis]